MLRYWFCVSFLLFSSIHAEGPKPSGQGAMQSSVQASYTQNWAFAGVALAAAVLGIVVVSLDQGAGAAAAE